MQTPYTGKAVFVYGKAERAGSCTKSGIFVYEWAERRGSCTKSGIFVYETVTRREGGKELALQPGEEIVYAGAGDGEIREFRVAAPEGDL